MSNIAQPSSQLNIRSDLLRLRSAGPGESVWDLLATVSSALNKIQDYASNNDQKLANLLGSSGVLSLLPQGPVFSVPSLAVNIGNEIFKVADSGVYIGIPKIAPTDANIPPNHCFIWLNEGANLLTFRVRYSNGTLKTGTVALV